MEWLILAAGLLCSIATLAHLMSILVVAARVHRAETRRPLPRYDVAVSILRPVCGIENHIEETLRTSFQLDHPHLELLFCVAKADDPVVPVVRALMAAYPQVEARLLIGNISIGVNPKLNNLVKGWNAARHDWILMTDSNVRMPADHVERMLSAWRSGTGLVCSPPIGCAPRNFWAELECAFLDTYQARWQCFADSVGLGFAQGKSMLFRRDIMERAGGIEALAREVAEDAAATKAVRMLDLEVRLVAAPFEQPLGQRSAADVWHRQLRWARLRRDTFRGWFIPELLAGGIPPLALAAVVVNALNGPVLAMILPLALVWYGAEAMLAYRAGWPLSWRSVPAWLLRDALLPPLWLASWLGSDFEWRGNAMTIADPHRAT